jgi:FkbM family methyltransferase
VRCNGGSDNFIFSEVFDHLYYNLPLQIVPQTILDLGANAGFATLFFSRKYPAAEIACVEPIPENIECLKLNFTLNEVAARVFEAAIAPYDGTASMALADMDYGHHICEESATDGRGTLRVPTISIATCMTEMKWQRINLLKMDIEGYESVLLFEKCEWLHLVDAIFIEWHGDNPRENLQKLAKAWGFLEPELQPGIWLLRREEPRV